MLLSFLHTYAFILVAVVVSATGLAMLLRGLRIAGRRRRRECVQCGYVLSLPTAPPIPDDRPLSAVCTECGRDPALDTDALRAATALIALGIAAQFVWILLGAARWNVAAVLLVETSVALLVFAAEPIIERLRRRFGGQPRLKPVPQRRWLRVVAGLVVVLGWGWILGRVQSGQHIRSLIALRPQGTPFCRALVTNRTEWMDRVLPPDLVYYARVAGVIAEVPPDAAKPLPPEIMSLTQHAWVHGSIARAARVIDFTRLSELSLLHIDDELFFASDLPALPPLESIRVLSLDGSSLTPKSIESLVKSAPNLRTLRVNYLNASDADVLRKAFPNIDVDAAEFFSARQARPRGTRPTPPRVPDSGSSQSSR